MAKQLFGRDKGTSMTEQRALLDKKWTPGNRLSTLESRPMVSNVRSTFRKILK